MHVHINRFDIIYVSHLHQTLKYCAHCRVTAVIIYRHVKLSHAAKYTDSHCSGTISLEYDQVIFNLPMRVVL